MSLNKWNIAFLYCKILYSRRKNRFYLLHAITLDVYSALGFWSLLAKQVLMQYVPNAQCLKNTENYIYKNTFLSEQ